MDTQKGQPTVTSVLHKWRTIINEAMEGKEYTRAFLLQGKIEIDDELSRTKESIGKAKMQAHMKGNFMPPEKFRALQDKARDLGNLSQTMMIAIKQAGDREKAKNRLVSNQEDRLKAMDFARMFVQVAREKLPPLEFRRLADIAEGRRMQLASRDNETDGGA